MQPSHELLKLVRQYKQGSKQGIASICSANEFVIEAAMIHAAEHNYTVLIEATSNQVNQYGGYTGMCPADFSVFVKRIGERLGFPADRLLLGGDHLGPNPWSKEDGALAMEKACQMVGHYVAAGFTKIHLDASMHLGGDPKPQPVNPEIVAERGALLCQAAEHAYDHYRTQTPDAPPPVYVIGTEVPTPGGSQTENEEVTVTEVSDFRSTVELQRRAFLANGLEQAWERVIAVVVQPGVEFGDHSIHEYDSHQVQPLSRAVADFAQLVLEGHSTDYQTREALRQMVHDGIVILKVGPALTFALREAFFALEMIEQELLGGDSSAVLSNLARVLDRAMVGHPSYWQSHYHGDERAQAFARRFSLSDRSRYYWPVAEVQQSVEQLVENLRTQKPPLSLLSQYMPRQYRKIRSGVITNDPPALVRDKIGEVLDDYWYAVQG